MDLSEAVIVLQRQELAPETRDVVEEAARLLGEGREGEARALIEKAEALAALGDSADATPNKNDTTSHQNPAPSLRETVAPLAARLAEGLTGVLTGVLEEVHRFAGDQVHAVAQSLQERIEELDAALCDVVVVGERLEQRASDQHQDQQELWAAVRGLQQAGQEQSETVLQVSAATNELAKHMAGEVEAVASRFVSLEERVGGLEVFAQEIPAQLSGLIARLDGHTDALRSLEHRQTQRVSRLNQVLESLASLRETEDSPLAMPAVA